MAAPRPRPRVMRRGHVLVTVQLVAERTVRHAALEDHHRDADDDARHEEVERDVRRVPQRVNLVLREKEQGTERRLVEGREHHAHDRERDGQLQRERPCLAPSEPLEDRREELEPEHRQVERHAPGHFEHHRQRAERPHHGNREVPRQPEVEQQADDDEEIPERAGQHRGAHDRVVLLQPEDVHRRRHRVAARRQRDAADDVERDPQPPRARLREVRRGAEAVDEPVDDHRDPDGENQRRDGVGRREQAARVLAWLVSHQDLVGEPRLRGRCRLCHLRHGRSPFLRRPWPCAG